MATGSVASIRRFWITKGMWRKVNEWKRETRKVLEEPFDT